MNVDGRPSKKFLTEKRKWLISMLEADGEKIQTYLVIYGKTISVQHVLPCLVQRKYDGGDTWPMLYRTKRSFLLIAVQRICHCIVC